MDERTLLAAAQAANEFQKERRPSDVNAAGGMGGRRRSFQFNDPALIPEEVLDKRAARKSDSWLKWIGKTLSGKNPGDADFDGLDVAVDEAAPITFGRSRRPRPFDRFWRRQVWREEGAESLRVGGHRSLLCARMHVLWTPGLPDARVP